MARASTPSLTSLRAFEAYARRGRLVDAADELCVTHGAVSRQIKQLERQLGVRLLTGHPGKVRLTDQAAHYAGELTRLFDEIDALCASLRQASEARLQILCPGSFAMRWLIPRVQEFRARHPEVELEIVDSSGPWSAGVDGPHGAIRIEGFEGTRGAQARVFMPRAHGPVLSPDLLASVALEPDRILALPRLHIRTLPSDWCDWAAAADVELPPPARDLAFGRSFHMLEAALSGLGVGLADQCYVAAEIAAGRLAAPMGFVPSSRSYVLLRGAQCRSRPLDLFENWLVEAGSPLPNDPLGRSVQTREAAAGPSSAK